MENNKIPMGVNPADYPDFWNQMQNFQKFLKDVGQGAASGNSVLVSEEKRLKREELCNECPSFNKESKRCRECGCFMEVKWRFTKAECPMNIW